MTRDWETLINIITQKKPFLIHRKNRGSKKYGKYFPLFISLWLKKIKQKNERIKLIKNDFFLCCDMTKKFLCQRKIDIFPVSWGCDFFVGWGALVGFAWIYWSKLLSKRLYLPQKRKKSIRQWVQDLLNQAIMHKLRKMSL